MLQIALLLVFVIPAILFFFAQQKTLLDYLLGQTRQYKKPTRRIISQG